MIIAEFFGTESEIMGFKISGHAGYDEHGRDIVCAAVSSAVQLTANMITEIFGYDAEVSAEGDTVILKTTYSGEENLQKIFKGLLLQLECISQEFEGTIKIKFTEV